MLVDEHPGKNSLSRHWYEFHKEVDEGALVMSSNLEQDY